MSRSNYGRPFFVDVGTSIAAVRCQSNRDVLDRFDHVRMGRACIAMANKMCDRMNAEVEKFIAAKDAEIENLKKENAQLLVINCGATYAEGHLREEIEKLRALVGELAECLYGNPCTGCGMYRCSFCKHRRRMNALVAKAREVVK